MHIYKNFTLLLISLITSIFSVAAFAGTPVFVMNANPGNTGANVSIKIIETGTGGNFVMVGPSLTLTASEGGFENKASQVEVMANGTTACSFVFTCGKAYMQAGQFQKQHCLVKETGKDGILRQRTIDYATHVGKCTFDVTVKAGDKNNFTCDTKFSLVP